MIKFILFPLIAFVLVGITNELTIKEDSNNVFEFERMSLIFLQLSFKVKRLIKVSVYDISK